MAPPTLNLENGDAAAEGVDLVSREARRMTIEHAISNGFWLRRRQRNSSFDVGNVQLATAAQQTSTFFSAPRRFCDVRLVLLKSNGLLLGASGFYRLCFSSLIIASRAMPPAL